jgi:ADP-ribosyl-[dinitrogen reductase] hydrolase
MRILPFAFIPDSDVDAIHHAHLTHNHKESDQAIKMYLWLVRQALQGKTKESMGVWGSYSGKSGGYVVETMDTVLHCFFTTTSFEDAIVLCCSLGHDSDTNCQILGGLAGAYYGCDSIPTRWTEALDQSIMQQLAGLSIGLQGVEVPR